MYGVMKKGVEKRTNTKEDSREDTPTPGFLRLLGQFAESSGKSRVSGLGSAVPIGQNRAADGGGGERADGSRGACCRGDHS